MAASGQSVGQSVGWMYTIVAAIGQSVGQSVGCMQWWQPCSRQSVGQSVGSMQWWQPVGSRLGFFLVFFRKFTLGQSMGSM